MSENKLSVHGVPGKITRAEKSPELWRKQKWTSEPRPVDAREYGKGRKIRAEIRFDDECGNGHNSFAITAHIYHPQAAHWDACGCLHDEIARYFPELAHLIPWHLTGSDGPMHYEANTLYLASDRDHNGRAAGEPSHFDTYIKFGNFPIAYKTGRAFWQWLKDTRAGFAGEFDYEIHAMEHGREPGGYQYKPKYTFLGYGSRWHECPFDSEREAEEFLAALQNFSPEFVELPTAYSEGKARELDAARRAANWPEATDAQLCADKETLREALRERLPALLASFRADVEKAGFSWAPVA